VAAEGFAGLATGDQISDKLALFTEAVVIQVVIFAPAFGCAFLKI
jgi:hypothetical protein